MMLVASTHMVLSDELARLLGEHAPVGGALAEGLERGQALDGVEEFRAEGLEAPLAREARAAVEAVERASAA